MAEYDRNNTEDNLVIYSNNNRNNFMEPDVPKFSDNIDLDIAAAVSKPTCDNDKLVLDIVQDEMDVFPESNSSEHEGQLVNYESSNGKLSVSGSDVDYVATEELGDACSQSTKFSISESEDVDLSPPIPGEENEEFYPILSRNENANFLDSIEPIKEETGVKPHTKDAIVDTSPTLGATAAIIDLEDLASPLSSLDAEEGREGAYEMTEEEVYEIMNDQMLFPDFENDIDIKDVFQKNVVKEQESTGQLVMIESTEDIKCQRSQLHLNELFNRPTCSSKQRSESVSLLDLDDICLELPAPLFGCLGPSDSTKNFKTPSPSPVDEKLGLFPYQSFAEAQAKHAIEDLESNLIFSDVFANVEKICNNNDESNADDNIQDEAMDLNYDFSPMETEDPDNTTDDLMNGNLDETFNEKMINEDVAMANKPDEDRSDNCDAKAHEDEGDATVTVDSSPEKPKYYFIDAASLLEEEPPLPCLLKYPDEMNLLGEMTSPKEDIDQLAPVEDIGLSSELQSTNETVNECSARCSECGNTLVRTDSTDTETMAEEANSPVTEKIKIQENERRQGSMLFQNTISQYSKHEIVTIQASEVIMDAPVATSIAEEICNKVISKMTLPQKKHPGTFAYMLNNPSLVLETELDSPKKKLRITSEDTPSPADSLNDEEGGIVRRKSWQLERKSETKPEIVPESTAYKNITDIDSIPIVSGGLTANEVLTKPDTLSKYDRIPHISNSLKAVEFQDQPTEHSSIKPVDNAPLAVGYFLDLQKEEEEKKVEAQASKTSMFSMFIDFSEGTGARPKTGNEHTRQRSISQLPTWFESAKETQKQPDIEPIEVTELIKPPKEKPGVYMFIEADNNQQKRSHVKPTISLLKNEEEKPEEPHQVHKRAQSFSTSERVDTPHNFVLSNNAAPLEGLAFSSPVPRRSKLPAYLSQKLNRESIDVGLLREESKHISANELSVDNKTPLARNKSMEQLQQESELSISQMTLSSDSQLIDSSECLSLSESKPLPAPTMPKREAKLTFQDTLSSERSPHSLGTPQRKNFLGRTNKASLTVSKTSTASGTSTSGSGEHNNVEEMDATLSETSELSSMQSSMDRSGIATTSETDSSNHKGRLGGPCSQLGEDLLRMFLEEINTDVVIEVGSHKLRAHKCILSSRCQYFAAMLSGGWIESEGNVISLQGFSYNSVHFALCHIYSGASDIPNTINIVELSTLADMLGLEGLKEVISYTLKVKYCHFFHKPCSVCVVGVLECLPLSAAYGLDEVYRKSLRWITKYFTRIWPTKAFASLPCELIEKCYSQNVVHLSVENVMDTVLSCDKLLATLPNVRWAEPVFGITARLLEASIKFMSKKFSSLLISERFLALGRNMSWNISQLEDTILTAIGCMATGEACQSHHSLKKLLENMEKQDNEKEWSPNFVEFVKKIIHHLECHLCKHANRAVQCQKFDLLDEEMQRKLTENVFLQLKLDKPKMSGLQKKQLTGSNSSLASNVYCTLPRKSRHRPYKSYNGWPSEQQQCENESNTASPLVKRAAAILRAQRPFYQEATFSSRTSSTTILERPTYSSAKTLTVSRLGHQRSGSAGMIEKLASHHERPFGEPFSPRKEPKVPASLKEKMELGNDATRSPLHRPKSQIIEKPTIMIKNTSTSSSCVSSPSVISRPVDFSQGKKNIGIIPKHNKIQVLASTTAKSPRSPTSKIPTVRNLRPTGKLVDDRAIGKSPVVTPVHRQTIRAASLATANKFGNNKLNVAAKVNTRLGEMRPRASSFSQPTRSSSNSADGRTPVRPVTTRPTATTNFKNTTEKVKVLSPNGPNMPRATKTIQVLEKFQRPLSPKVAEPKSKMSPRKTKPMALATKATSQNGNTKPIAIVAPKSTRAIRDVNQHQRHSSPRNSIRNTEMNTQTRSTNQPTSSPKRDVKFLSESSRSGTFLKDEPTVMKRPNTDSEDNN